MALPINKLILQLAGLESKLPIFCRGCSKSGHLTDNCPDEQLPACVPLPPPSAKHREILSNVLTDIKGEEVAISLAMGYRYPYTPPTLRPCFSSQMADRCSQGSQINIQSYLLGLMNKRNYYIYEHKSVALDFMYTSMVIWQDYKHNCYNNCYNILIFSEAVDDSGQYTSTQPYNQGPIFCIDSYQFLLNFCREHGNERLR